MNNQDGIQILLNLCGVFGHYEFFTDKLWKKVKGFKNADEAEILNYFMISELYSKGLYYCSLGMTWGSPCDKETCEHYLEKFAAVGKAYREWRISKR